MLKTSANSEGDGRKNSQYTLFLDTIRGPGHVETAKKLKDDLLARYQQMPDFYLVHGENETSIYYGYYRSFGDNSKESQRAKRDLQTLRDLSNRQGDKIFRSPVPVAMNTGDPVAPQEWDLLNTQGFWSIEIATFKDNPLRKEAAVQAVRELRNQGVTNAYFYHGPTASSVCIGAWPRDAVKEQDRGTGETSETNPQQPVLVYSGPGAMPPVLKDKNNQTVKGYKITVEYNDPSIPETFRKYEVHTVNYEATVRKGLDKQTGKPKDIYAAPFLFIIPRTEKPDAPAVPAAQEVVVPRPAPTPGVGRLRSLGE